MQNVKNDYLSKKFLKFAEFHLRAQRVASFHKCSVFLVQFKLVNHIIQIFYILTDLFDLWTTERIKNYSF